MALVYNFVDIESFGAIALSERPKIKEIHQLNSAHCTRVVTILAERGEQAHRIGSEVQAQGMEWDWVKVKHIVKMEKEEIESFRRQYKNIAKAVRAGEFVLVHCSAGLHRTGVFTFCVLHELGFSEDSIVDYIGKIRIKTREAFEQKYRDIALGLIMP